MNRTDTALIGFKVLGLYILSQAVETLSAFTSMFLTNREALQEISAAQWVLPTSLNIVIGLSLWHWAGAIGASIFKDAPPEHHEMVSSADFQQVCYSIIGVAILALAIPDIGSAIGHYLGTKSVAGAKARPEAFAWVWSKVLGALAKIAVAIVLVFRSGGIVRIISWSRTAGT